MNRKCQDFRAQGGLRFFQFSRHTSSLGACHALNAKLLTDPPAVIADWVAHGQMSRLTQHGPLKPRPCAPYSSSQPPDSLVKTRFHNNPHTLGVLETFFTFREEIRLILHFIFRCNILTYPVSINDVFFQNMIVNFDNNGIFTFKPHPQTVSRIIPRHSGCSDAPVPRQVRQIHPILDCRMTLNKLILQYRLQSNVFMQQIRERLVN